MLLHHLYTSRSLPLFILISLSISLVFDIVVHANRRTATIATTTDSRWYGSPPIKVYILAGQSNMVGLGSIDHLDLLIQNSLNNTNIDPVFRATLWNETNRSYNKRNDVYITYGSNHGPLTVSRTAGYAGPNSFGPEVMLGWTLTDNLKRTCENNNNSDTAPLVLLIKVAYGGRDLAIDFRPPSAGIGNYSVRASKYGWQYRIMINDTINALNNIATYIPNYNKNAGYNLAGFVWFQGWNDLLDWRKVNEYESNLVHLISDVRNDLGVVDLPFVVGELGMHGINPRGEEADRVLALRAAQYNACNNYDEFQSTTKFVPTAMFAVLNGTIKYDGIYHYYGRADTYYYIGEALGKALWNLTSQETNKCDSVLVSAIMWIKHWIGILLFNRMRTRIF